MKSTQLNEFTDLTQPTRFFIKRSYISNGKNPSLHIIVKFVTDNSSLHYLENINKQLNDLTLDDQKNYRKLKHKKNK